MLAKLIGRSKAAQVAKVSSPKHQRQQQGDGQGGVEAGLEKSSNDSVAHSAPCSRAGRINTAGVKM
jgi:hypothetical protein